MTSKKLLPCGTVRVAETPLNAIDSVRTPKPHGFYIFLKYQYYECKRHR